MRHYHVVCRECTYEQLEATDAAAKYKQKTHQFQTDHKVVSERIE